MFARAHRPPDPTRSSTLEKFPVAGLFPRFWAPPHFPALTYCFVLSLSFSQFHPFIGCCSTHSSCHFALPKVEGRESFLFLLYSSHYKLISYHNRQRLIIFAKIKETNGCNPKSRNYHIICRCQCYLTMQSK